MYWYWPLTPDPFPAFLCPVVPCSSTGNYISQAPLPISFWIGSANQSHWKKKVALGRREKARVVSSLCPARSLQFVCLLWLPMNSSFLHGSAPDPSGRSVVVPTSVWWPQLQEHYFLLPATERWQLPVIANLWVGLPLLSPDLSQVQITDLNPLARSEPRWRRR